MKVLRYKDAGRRVLPATDERVVLLVRHGASKEDLLDQFCGWCDSPMVELGHQQMATCAQFMEQFEYGDVYTDDLERTDESAAYLMPGSLTGLQVKTPLLRAWGLGPTFSGLVKTPELEALRKQYVRNPDDLPPGPDSETLNHNRTGWLAAFTYVVSNTNGPLASVIVCHSNGPKILSAVYCPGNRLKLGHGGVMAVRIRPDGVLLEVVREGWFESTEDGGDGG